MEMVYYDGNSNYHMRNGTIPTSTLARRHHWPDIVGFGGINKLAEEALRAIQRHWRATRNIARRRAAYHIQYFAGVNFRWVHLLNYDYYDETNIPRIRKFNRLRTALRPQGYNN